MSQAFFPGIESIRYEGPNSENPLAITHTRPSMNATRIAHVIFRQ